MTTISSERTFSHVFTFLRRIMVFLSLALIATNVSANQIDVGEKSEKLINDIYRETGILFQFTAEDCAFGRPKKSFPCIIMYVKDVRAGSIAAISGILPGYHLNVRNEKMFSATVKSDHEHYLNDVYQRSERVLIKFWRDYKSYNGILPGYAWKLSDVLELSRAKKGFAKPPLSEALPFILGKSSVEEFWGVNFDVYGNVLDVRDDGFGQKFGFLVGDYLTDQNNLAPDLFFFWRSLSAIAPEWAYTSEMPVYLNRNGKRINLGAPKFKLMELGNPQFALSSLTGFEQKAFDEIPALERNFFKSVYIGNFERAIYEKNLIERASASASFVKILGEGEVGQATAKLERARQDASRLEILLARYAVIKAQTVGLCGAKPTRFKINETWIRTLRNGFGITLSETIEKDEERYFEVDERFARFVADHEVSDQSVFLERGYAEFIRNAGGCDSETLAKFESKFLEFISYE